MFSMFYSELYYIVGWADCELKGLGQFITQETFWPRHDVTQMLY